MSRKITHWLLISLSCIALGRSQDGLILHGSRNPLVDSFADEGRLADSRRVEGLQVRFKPSPAQSATLAQLLEDQQNPASPQYHAWLTPEEFGDRFGPGANDLGRVRA